MINWTIGAFSNTRTILLCVMDHMSKQFFFLFRNTVKVYGIIYTDLFLFEGANPKKISNERQLMCCSILFAAQHNTENSEVNVSAIIISIFTAALTL